MIKLFGFLLMTAGLIGGALSAITAYRPLLTLPDSALVGLELVAAAGSNPDHPHEPILARGTKLTEADLAQLRAAGAKRVVVKEFSFER